MSIIIGADCVPTDVNINYFSEGDSISLVGDRLYKVLSNVDFRIFNLEIPLTNFNNSIKKYGPNLSAPTKTVKGMKSLGINLFTLANNHILDHGEQGMKSTIDILKKNNINFVGGGSCLDEARKPFFKIINKKKIGVIGFTENEFSNAKSDKYGANPFDFLVSFDDVKAAAKECDYLIVLYHGGKEEYRYPSPYLKGVCHKIVDCGADLVICQHSHCIGCMECYNECRIVYGQGNFIFNYKKSEYWKTSLLIKIDDNFNLDFIPICQTPIGTRLASDEEAKQIIDDFNKRSSFVLDDAKLKHEYDILSEKYLEKYLCNICGVSDNLVFRVINKISRYKFTKKYMNLKYKKTELMALLNYMECEAHRDLIINGLKNKIDI